MRWRTIRNNNHFFFIFADFTLAAIYAIIGSTENVSISPKKSQRISRNSFAVNANTHVTHKSCSACAANRTMNHSFTFAVINARTGSMADASAFCKAKQTASMNTFVRIVRKIAQWTWPIWKKWTTRNMKIWRNWLSKFRWVGSKRNDTWSHSFIVNFH